MSDSSPTSRLFLNRERFLLISVGSNVLAFIFMYTRISYMFYGIKVSGHSDNRQSCFRVTES